MKSRTSQELMLLDNEMHNDTHDDKDSLRRDFYIF